MKILILKNDIQIKRMKGFSLRVSKRQRSKSFKKQFTRIHILLRGRIVIINQQIDILMLIVFCVLFVDVALNTMLI